jgi:regulator of protease activity HflC (stomatin/prohibitin superfamily)
VRVETFDARAVRFRHAALEQALRVPGGVEALDSVEVPPGSVGLFLVDGVVKEELAPGRHAWWKAVAPARVVVVDRREQAFEVAGQEVVTKDKATVRLNVAVVYRVASARRWVEETADARGALYREVQLAVRASIGLRTLDELLVARDAVGLEVQASVARRAEAIGATIASVGLKDVMLPGELRALVSQVLEAEKRAQANLIARREETAATRALLNTAKLYAENPTLLRLKELETAERIAEKVAELRVGGLDELLARLLPKSQTS